MQDWDSAGLLVVVPQEFESVQVLVCISLIAHSDQASHIHDSEHEALLLPPPLVLLLPPPPQSAVHVSPVSQWPSPQKVEAALQISWTQKPPAHPRFATFVPAV